LAGLVVAHGLLRRKSYNLHDFEQHASQ
jgi:hypothetical protein